MKRIFASLIFSCAFASVAVASPDTAEKEVIIGFNEVFVPTGLSSTSEAYVIASGFFPNSCYRWSHADVTNVNEFVHEIQATATVRQGLCMMVMVRFQKNISLGRLPSGEHLLRFRNGDGTFFEKTIVVR